MSCLLTIFNNATVATVIAVLIGAGIASWQYRLQKKIDLKNERKKEVWDNLLLLNQKLKYVLFILDRIVNTQLSLDTNSRMDDFIEALRKYEVPRLSNALNEDIPLLDMKIANILDLYFNNDDKIRKNHEDYKKELKKWHDYLINEIPGPKFHFYKKTSEIPELSIKTLEQSIKNLIQAIS